MTTRDDAELMEQLAAALRQRLLRVRGPRFGRGGVGGEILVSDGFGGTFGTTDGLGHAGSAQLGAGHDWTELTGTWANADGRLSPASLSGGQAVATIDAGAADVVIRVKSWLESPDLTLVLRLADFTHYLRVTKNGTQVIVGYVVTSGGTYTSTTVTPIDGAELVASVKGDRFRVHYAGVLYADVQIHDATLLSGTTAGLVARNADTQFDDFVITRS